MITGDPINDDIQWLLQELKQVNEDLEAVNTYYSFVERGNTVSIRYEVVDEGTEIKEYLQKQLEILNYARDNILFELECLDESYLENPPE
jgi:hypothetical protein